MLAELTALFDPASLALVLGGTAFATVARCGLRETGMAGAALLRHVVCRFDEAANRAVLARDVSKIAARGYLCADLPPAPDPHIADAIEHYRRKGSPAAMRSHAEAKSSERVDLVQRAVQPFEQAGELAPVLGLAGTLLAIAQLVPGEGASGAAPTSETLATSAAIASAVLSSLYGVVAAHFVLVPLGRAIERDTSRVEALRCDLMDWAATLLETGRGAANGHEHRSSHGKRADIVPVRGAA